MSEKKTLTIHGSKSHGNILGPYGNCIECGHWLRKTDDEFCSTKCAKIHFGTITAEEQKRRDKDHREIMKRETQSTIKMDNPHVNKEKHEGPQTRRVRRIG